MASELVLSELTEGVCYLTLNDPAKLNPLSRPMVAALQGALEEAWQNPAARVIVLRGAGGSFSGGGDVNSMKTRIESYRAGKEPDIDPRVPMRNLARLSTTIREIDKPVIAWLEGAVVGGGLALAMVADFSIADEAAKFIFAFVNIGLSPDMGASKLLTNRVGAPLATDLMMTGRRFSGRDAADWGIITRALPADRLEQEVTGLAQKLASGPASSYAQVKREINKLMYAGFAEAIEHETETQAALMHNADHWEAVDAFFEKRAPNFRRN